MYWQSIAKTCGACHEKEAKALRDQRAWQGRRGDARGAVCTDCHGEHAVRGHQGFPGLRLPGARPKPAGSATPPNASPRNTRCRPRCSTPTWRAPRPRQPDGGVAAANCASCHGCHDILPSTDAASSIHPSRLPETCGKCSAGIGTRLARGEMRIHQQPGAGGGTSGVTTIVVKVYIALILLVIGGMVVFNAADYMAKVRQHIREVRAHPGASLRMTPLLRVQHAILVLTFLILVYTGFTHKYPNTVWAWPFRMLEDGAALRSLLHRVAGWAFSALVVLHLLLLVFTPRGRQYMQHVPARSRRSRRHPPLPPQHRPGRPGPRARLFNFAEKANTGRWYRGSVVMIVTGVMLIFNSYVLSHLSPVWLEVAQVVHLYEAILASLAIVVWHLYWGHLRSARIPVNTAWLIGAKKPLHGAEPDEKHPAEITKG